jgi:hypothetical protein
MVRDSICLSIRLNTFTRYVDNGHIKGFVNASVLQSTTTTATTTTTTTEQQPSHVARSTSISLLSFDDPPVTTTQPQSRPTSTHINDLLELDFRSVGQSTFYATSAQPAQIESPKTVRNDTFSLPIKEINWSKAEKVQSSQQIAAPRQNYQNIEDILSTNTPRPIRTAPKPPPSAVEQQERVTHNVHSHFIDVVICFADSMHMFIRFPNPRQTIASNNQTK